MLQTTCHSTVRLHVPCLLPKFKPGTASRSYDSMGNIAYMYARNMLATYMRISTNNNFLGCEQPSKRICKIITQYPGHVSANARPLQLRWGDRECGLFTPCSYNTDGWPYQVVHAWPQHVHYFTEPCVFME